VIRRRYWPAQEEEVTFLLRGELRFQFDQATVNGVFANAFSRDLSTRCPNLVRSSTWPRALAERLVGNVSFHSRHHEGTESGSDFGLLIQRPVIMVNSYQHDVIVIKDGNPQALLVQAKLGRPAAHGDRSRWDTLTDRQNVLFRRHRHYFSLLLYRWTDAQGSSVAPLQWQQCANQSLRQVSQWLGRDRFPALQDSTELISDLARGKVGTADSDVIRNIISPAARRARAIRIRVGWPPGDVPPSGVVLSTRAHTKPQAVVTVRG
jgi:hypothetical protein